jgi:hypothetical protein
LFFIASFNHLVNKFGIIDVYKSQNVIIIISDFSICLIAFGLVFTSGIKYAFFILAEFSVKFKSIFVSENTLVQSSSSTSKSDFSKVTGITLHFTLNILQICFNPLSKLPVISAIAVISKFQRECHHTEQSLSYL